MEGGTVNCLFLFWVMFIDYEQRLVYRIMFEENWK